MFARLREKLLNKLESPSPHYRVRIRNNMKQLYRVIQKGDLILVEGDSDLSAIIKTFSHSHWSHMAYYVGDELIKGDHVLKDKLVTLFGENAGRLLVEASSRDGVVAVPLDKYKNYNIRLCRPFGITAADLNSVTLHVSNNLGKQYDQKNITNIALSLIPLRFNPYRRRNIKDCLGECSDFQVICSSMIAKAFQSVGYPIVPELSDPDGNDSDGTENPYGSRLIMRHYSQIMPRDFDLSPNFEVIKFNIIENGKFDYHSIWVTS